MIWYFSISMYFNLKTILFVLAICANITRVFSTEKHNEQLNLSVKQVIEYWYKNLSEYQKFQIPEKTLYYNNKINTEYLIKIFTKLLGNRYTTQDSLYQVKQFFETSKSFNVGYAILTFTINNGTIMFAIDCNKIIHYYDSQKNRWIKVKNDKNNNTSNIEMYVTKLSNKNCYVSNADDEFRILQILVEHNQEIHKIINSDTITDMKIDLFTYMDMCPSCWTIWNMDFDNLKKLYKCKNLEVNVYSIKPYKFSNHMFLTRYDYYYQNQNQNNNAILNTDVDLEQFDKLSTCVRRWSITPTKSKITQYIDTNNIEYLRNFYYKALLNNNTLLLELDSYYKNVSDIIKLCSNLNKLDNVMKSHNITFSISHSNTKLINNNLNYNDSTIEGKINEIFNNLCNVIVENSQSINEQKVKTIQRLLGNGCFELLKILVKVIYEQNINNAASSIEKIGKNMIVDIEERIKETDNKKNDIIDISNIFK